MNCKLSSREVLFSSSFLRDMKVLWMFETKQECSSFIRNRFYWDDVYTTVEKWDFLDIAKLRLAWVNVLGDPLNYWNEAFFFKLEEISGKPLLVVEETKLWKRLDKGRILVSIPFGHKVPSKIDIMGGGCVFSVFVEEELFPVCW
ncbi:hypothetical protein LWI28_018181 [Acer negundo]|uniref:DUF4283 domain-containing protein n=1 Tax=Acer negundo TaxID=4023 RepID=A0AAD5IWB9_ACENE|nr:hypothetical protein LWI28_018181 [Acer negundo]